MTYMPIDTANLFIAQIEIASTTASQAGVVDMNLGSIIIDTGGLISITGTKINLPDGYDVLAFSNLVMSGFVGTTLNQKVADFYINDLAQAASKVWRAGAFPGYDEYSFSSDACILSLKEDGTSRKLSLRETSTTTGFAVSYNSATTTIANSSITILYGVL